MPPTRRALEIMGAIVKSSANILTGEYMPLNKPEYEIKFKEFIRMCNDAKKKKFDVITIHHPHVLGDNYDEIIESLSRIAEFEIPLLIIER